MILIVAVGLILILLLSAFFSGSETALMSLDNLRLKRLEQTQPQAARLRKIVEHPEKVLGTILTGNVFINTAAGALLTYGVTVFVTSEDQRGKMISISTILLTALILVFGEMVPKSVAARYPESWSLFVIRPILVLIKIARPVVWLLSLISNSFLSLLGANTGVLGSAITLEEFKAILFSGMVPEGEQGTRRQMLHRVIELDEKKTAEVMVPRTEIVAIEKNTPLETIVQIIQNRRFSRMPVYHETLDNIIGLLFAKDVLRYWGTRIPFKLSHVLRKIYFVPDSAKIEQALEQLQQQRTHLAIVVDEHGGVEGLVTLEDLIEEIVGEFLDDKDSRENQVVNLFDGSFLLDASLSIKEVNEKLSVTIPEHRNYNTIAGAILYSLGHIPVIGEEIKIANLTVSVEKIEGHRILRVVAKKRN